MNFETEVLPNNFREAFKNYLADFFQNWVGGGGLEGGAPSKLRVAKVGWQQGGRTWQPFVGSKNGNENFRQARIYNFRDKCVVFVRNCKIANLTQ